MKNYLLKGKKVLVTAGPTREPLDPVRYISNQTGGKLGFDIAAAMLQQGASVFLISGPVKVDLNHPDLTVVKVNTAYEMYMACCRFFEDADIVVFAAAVSDYRPKEMFCKKIEHNEEVFTIKMVRNIDIAAAFANVKGRQLTVGVTADEGDNVQKAMSKMDRKNLDLIILNTVSSEAGGYNFDLQNVSIIRSDYSVQPFSSLKSKAEKIRDIIDTIAFAYQEKQETVLQLHPENKQPMSSSLIA